MPSVAFMLVEFTPEWRARYQILAHPHQQAFPLAFPSQQDLTELLSRINRLLSLESLWPLLELVR